jgi:hypothetical protein
VIDATTVSREFQSLVERRRELLMLLGSIFAGLSIVLQNGLQGNFPPALAGIDAHLFAFVSLVLMVASLVLSLRMARLHGGMVLNGVLFARLMQEQDFTRPGNPQRSARHNFLGASFLQFVLVDLIAGFSAAVLALAVGAPAALAGGLGGAVVLVWLVMYFRFHDQSASFALRKIADEPCGPLSRDEWERHVSDSLKNANDDMLACISFVGLMLFSALETLSGLGHIERAGDLRAEDIVHAGPVIYTALMVVTCLLQMIIYIRLRLAVGKFSLDLDPTDRPFRPLRLTDSLLGYILLAFLFAVSLHLFLDVVAPGLNGRERLLLGIDAGAFALAVVAEQIALVIAGRTFHGASSVNR